MDGCIHEKKKPTFCETRTLPLAVQSTLTHKNMWTEIEDMGMEEGRRERRKRRGNNSVPPTSQKLKWRPMETWWVGCCFCPLELVVRFGQNGKQGEQVHKSQPGPARRQMCVINSFHLAIFRSRERCKVRERFECHDAFGA